MGNITEIGQATRTIDGALCLSSAAICDLFDVTQKTLSDWVSKGAPRAAHGWYPIKGFLAWRGIIRPEGFIDTAINLQQRKLEVEISLKESQQELTSLKTDITSGKYLERDLVVEEYRRFFLVLKRAMLAIPRRLGGMFAAYVEPVEARRLEKELTATVNRALNSFADSVVIKDA